jgi:type IV pilus assembly protein PilP
MSQQSLAGLLLVALLLSACGPSRQDTLRDWIDEQRKASVPNVKKIPAPQPFQHLSYEQGERKDPFAKQVLVAQVNAEAEKASPDLSLQHKSRARQTLESIPLESMNFVGILEKQGRALGLVRADGVLHQVMPGQYIGKNYGKVLRVDEKGIQLREIAQDANGKWSERDAYLRIQGSNK